MSLRDQLVEAAAKAGYEGDAWEHVDEMQRILWRTDARIKLDAILDILEADILNWLNEADATSLHWGDIDTARSLILALRDSVGVEVDQ